MAIPDTPLTRGEQYLNSIASGGGVLPDVPLTRIEQYLAKIAGQDVKTPDVPLTRMEQYLDYIAEYGSGSGDITKERLEVTENGTYTAPSGTAYSPVVVDVPVNEPTFKAPSGLTYKANEVWNVGGNGLLNWTLSSVLALPFAFFNCINLKSFELHVPSDFTTGIGWDNNGANSMFSGCSNLERLVLDAPFSWFTAGTFVSYCNKLKEVQIGGINHPLAPTSSSALSNSLLSNLSNIQTVTVYVNAATVAEIDANITSKAPFGAPNATIIYRSSNTGEVIT